MRDSNHRSVLGNRPVVTITPTVYDRRALDVDSNIPLINSLNHLTYLTSNSEKVRETLASDGALERLVSILHGCYIPLFQLLGHDLKHVSKHKHAEMIWRQKNLAMCAWKWTLAFQCLVLTGTRGTEQIRKKVVSSGVVPLLATELDNYLIYHKNYDHFTGAQLDIDLPSLETEESYLKLRKDSSETYEEYIEYITGREPLRLSNDKDFVYEELSRPSMTLPSDFVDIWCSDSKCHHKNAGNSRDDAIHSCKHHNDSEETLADKEPNEDCYFQLDEEDDHQLSITIPRDFFLGRIVPKQDDVIWSLQLLAFISKYTYMKQQLQNVELIETLSFRAILGRVKERIKLTRNPIETLKLPLAKDTDMLDAYPIGTEKRPEIDPFLVELQKLVDECRDTQTKSDSNAMFGNQRSYGFRDTSNFTVTDKSRVLQEKHLVRDFEEKWNYDNLSIDLDDDTWTYINSKRHLDLFPLVERCTVSHENPHDMVYWSSVIMRNSCRKNEITGVRQCANFDCGKWEDYPRQFAKCRRCKRTKYCSRECQLKAWTYHRFWCHEGGSSVESSGGNTGETTPGTAQNSDTSTTATRTIHGNIPLADTLVSAANDHEPNATIIENTSVTISAEDSGAEANITTAATLERVAAPTEPLDIIQNRNVIDHSHHLSENR